MLSKNIIKLLNLKVLIVEVMEDHELENDEEGIDKEVDKDNFCKVKCICNSSAVNAARLKIYL